VHHSHQYAVAPDGIINSNKPESGHEVAAPNKLRELFYNKIDRVNSPDDVCRLEQSADETHYVWVRQKRAG